MLLLTGINEFTITNHYFWAILQCNRSALFLISHTFLCNPRVWFAEKNKRQIYGKLKTRLNAC